MNKTCKNNESSKVFWRTIYNFFVNKNKYTGNTELNEIDNTLDNSLLPLPISVDKYIEAVLEYYYVDKMLTSIKNRQKNCTTFGRIPSVGY